MKKNLIIALFGSFMLVACSPKVSMGSTKPQADTIKHVLNGKIFIRVYDENGQLSFNDELAEFFNQWKKDSNNLDGFRRSYIKTLSQEIHFFTGIKKSDIIKYMGPGDSKESHPKIIRFNLESGCGNPEFDCCWLELYFDENEMVHLSSVVCT